MTDRFRIALAQLNPIMGDIHGNLTRARICGRQRCSTDAHVVDWVPADAGMTMLAIALKSTS